MQRTEVYNTAKPLFLMTVGSGKATHLTVGNDETLCGRAGEYGDLRGDFCVRCDKAAMRMVAEKAAADEAEKIAEVVPTHVSSLVESATQDDDGDEGDTMKFTAEYKGEKFTRTSTTRTYTHVAVIERNGEFIAARWSMTPEAAAKRLPHGLEAERVATVAVTPEGAEPVADEAAQPTHVSELDTATSEPVESAPQDNNKETGGRTMAAKKLKLKDVRGDIRIGQPVGTNGALHALKPEVDANGRNVAYCPTKFKTPIRSFGPAMEQKPELELCAGCSKVVAT
jgi:hypothetical protein